MKKSMKERNDELAEFWKNHIDQWSMTELTQKEYCRQNNLSCHRFTYWKTKFKKGHLPVEFVQVAESVPMGHQGLKLNIGPALQIAIPDSFSKTTLEKVLTCLKVL